MENSMVYVSALMDSLQRKLKVLQTLEKLTKEQTDILKNEEPDIDRFDQIIQEKSKCLEELNVLDQGFEAFFAKIGEELQRNKTMYQSQILQMQNLIRTITDMGMQIEGLERRNKDAFQKYLMEARQEIKSFKVSNRTANSYYQNMANQHHEWQSYFLDQKK